MTDAAPTPTPSKGSLLIGCAVIAVVLVALTIGATILAGAGVLAWRWWHPPGPVDPDDPPIRDAVATAVESAVVALEQQSPKVKRRAGRGESRQYDALDDLIRSEHRGEPFHEINTILERTELAECPRVFGSMAAGFNQAAQRADTDYVRFYSLKMSTNFSTAKREAQNGASKNQLHESLYKANHQASDRLIRAIIAARDNRGDDGDDDPWGLSGYRIDDEHRDELRATSTPLPLMYGGQSMTANAPAEIDPRGWHQIENQGAMGSCQGHALSSVCEYAYLISSGEKAMQGRSRGIQLSRLCAYYNSQRHDNLLGSDCGSTLAGGLAAAMQEGICPEPVMPYRLPYDGQFTPGWQQAAAPFKIRRHTVCRNFNECYAFQASGQGGIEIGISLPRAYLKCNGIIESFDPSDAVGGHAMCFLGYTHKKTDSQGRPYLWLANSWGTEWGDQGYALVSPSAVEAMCRHPQTVMIGLSDMAKSDIRPRDVSWIGKGSVFLPAPDAPLPADDEQAEVKPRRDMQWTGKGSVF